MPLYEYYCRRCDGIFEYFRPMRDAALPAPCPQCHGEGQRIMSTFNAFTVRDGYPRRLPDKGTYWHLGREVKTLAKRMRHYEHPELAEPEPQPKPSKGELEEKQERERAEKEEARYLDKWGMQKVGERLIVPSPKQRRPPKSRTILTPQGRAESKD
jgi:putative FmdB family regulatory protein